jgi:aspartate aminotransferase
MDSSENLPGRVSGMAKGLIGSEVLKIAADIRALAAEGRHVCNLTVGDFSPSEFRIPRFLEENIREALQRGETNYPPSDGMLALRKAILAFYERWLHLEYPLESVLITAGSRPGIYVTYAALVDPGDVVVYPVPSWNNNHYCHLMGAAGRPVVCDQADSFLPTRETLEKSIRGARLLALNSPLNPTGTAFNPDVLRGICDLVLEENARRSSDERPLYVLYDQVYWMLTFGQVPHVDPVSTAAAMQPYTVYVDGISKAFAATGLRVGWVAGPQDVIHRMASILGHLGAWAPRAEQIATARLLGATGEIQGYHREMKKGLLTRLSMLYDALRSLRNEGYPVDTIPASAGIYLSARFNLNGWRTESGEPFNTNEQIRLFLLQRAGLAVVPFQAFGSVEETGWFRLSVGAASIAEISSMLPRLRTALQELTRV